MNYGMLFSRYIKPLHGVYKHMAAIMLHGKIGLPKCLFGGIEYIQFIYLPVCTPAVAYCKRLRFYYGCKLSPPELRYLFGIVYVFNKRLTRQYYTARYNGPRKRAAANLVNTCDALDAEGLLQLKWIRYARHVQAFSGMRQTSPQKQKGTKDPAEPRALV